MKDYLHLFIPVTEALPEKCDDNYLTILKNGDVNFSYFGFRNYFSENQDLWNIPIQITHWLDLSKLTTKERATALAEKAVQYGWFMESGEAKGTIMDFINENKGNL